jgi:hypothetical protein
MGRRARLLTGSIVIGLIGGALGSAAPGATAGSAPDPSVGSVSVTVANPAVLAGQPVRFRGVVKPRRAGLRVGLQERVGGGWKNIGSTRTTAEGRYRLTATPDFGGIYKYRVIRLPWLTTSARSRIVTVTSYEWASVETFVEDGDWDVNAVTFEQTASIDGVTYPNSTVIDADSLGTTEGGYFDANLVGLGCAAFDATFGAMDGNAADSEVGAKVRAVGGAVLEEDSYALGESEHLTLDVRGVNRLRVEGLVVKPGPFGRLGIGTPRVLCAS